MYSFLYGCTIEFPMFFIINDFKMNVFKKTYLNLVIRFDQVVRSNQIHFGIIILIYTSTNNM